MASICNDEQASSGVMSGHDRKTLSLSGLQIEHENFRADALLQPHRRFIAKHHGVAGGGGLAVHDQIAAHHVHIGKRSAARGRVAACAASNRPA